MARHLTEANEVLEPGQRAATVATRNFTIGADGIAAWFRIRIVINGAGTLISVYVNNVLQMALTQLQITNSINLAGTYIGVNGDGAGNGAYMRNIVVF